MSNDRIWSELPPELIAAISRFLTAVADCIRFRSVCSSWRSAATPTLHHLPLQPPSIALPPLLQQDESTPLCNFLTLPTSTLRSLPLPLFPNFLGSSDGLLILHSSPISILNPITLSLTPLPFIRTFPLSPFFIKKLVLSPPPFPSALALLASSTHLALSLHPHHSWSLIESTVAPHDALSFHGRFHVVDSFRRVFSLHDDEKGGTLVEVARVRIVRAPPFIRRGEKYYLVDSTDDLLLVIRLFASVKMDGRRDSVVTKGFEVFRLDFERDSDGELSSSSSEIKSLGDRMLFLGLNRSISASIDECPGFTINCIYFLDDTLNSLGDVAQRNADAGVFDTGDGSIRELPFCSGGSGLVFGRRPAVWFTRSLC